jgi:hypothetical protein
VKPVSMGFVASAIPQKDPKMPIGCRTPAKGPKVTGPIFLKNSDRVNALAYVFLMALMVYSVMQRRVRRALKDEGIPLKIIGAKGTFRPTGRRVLEHFSNMGITKDEHGKREFPINIKVPRRVMRLLG